MKGTVRRGTKCVAQTINLSNPETCVRPKRIQKLVQSDATRPCPNVTAGTKSYWTPRPVAIKICTRKDMQRTCSPKLCDCPQKAPPKSMAQKLCSTLIFLLKSGIAAGLVYWTHSEGLWGSSEDVEDLYRRIVSTICTTNDYDEIELPHLHHFRYVLIEKYNKAVFTVMNCILTATYKLRDQFRHMMDPCAPTKPCDEARCPCKKQTQSTESTESSTETAETTES